MNFKSLNTAGNSFLESQGYPECHNLQGGILALKMDHNTSWNSTSENAILQVTAGRSPGCKDNSCLQLSQYSDFITGSQRIVIFTSFLVWEKNYYLFVGML